MKIKIVTNSNANIASRNQVVIDIADLGVSIAEWNEMSDKEKDKLVLEYCWETEMLSYHFEEM